jgi:ligand-binding sensor protein/AraC-like DNA-binding protein
MLLQLKQNKQLLDKIVKDFSLATGLAAVVVDIRGIEVSRLYNFTPFCQQMRTSPQYRELCQQCDLFGGLETAKSGNPHIYKCHAGLIDFAVPLIAENQLIGFILSGQIVCDNPKDYQNFPHIHMTKSSWQDQEELAKAYKSVPSFSADRIVACAELLKVIANYYLNSKIEKGTSGEQLSLLHPKKNQSPDVNKEIRKALKYIDKNLNRNITLEEVSSHVYLSTHYFSRLFKKEINMTFVEYVSHKKMEMAKDMLANTALPIGTIASNLGFSQASYFCKVFQKKWNISPRDYRKLQ